MLRQRRVPRVVIGVGKVQRGPSEQITSSLLRSRAGDRAALVALLPLVYDKFRRLSHHYFQRERPDHSLLGISPSTVRRGWNTARVWLYRELDRTASV